MGRFEYTEDALNRLAANLAVANAFACGDADLQAAYLAKFPDTELSPETAAIGSFLRLPALGGRKDVRLGRIIVVGSRFQFPDISNRPGTLGLSQNVKTESTLKISADACIIFMIGPQKSHSGIPTCRDFVAITQSDHWSFSGRVRWFGEDIITEAKRNNNSTGIIIAQSAWDWWLQHQKNPQSRFVYPFRTDCLVDLYGLSCQVNTTNARDGQAIQAFLEKPQQAMPKITIMRPAGLTKIGAGA